MLSFWLTTFAQRTSAKGKSLRRHPSQSGRIRRAYRPALEQFEDRLVPAAATHFQWIVPSSIGAFAPFSATLTALDQSNNVATTYSGTVHFSKSDTSPFSTVPADYTFVAGDSGQHPFSNGFALATAGNQTLTATDVASSSITGTSSAINVGAAAANQFLVTGPSTATAGVPVSFTVTALDQFYNTAAGYTGTVRFISSDASASLPASSTLTNGTATFSVTLKTAGSQTITAYDTVTSAITGRSGVVVVGNIATHFQVSAPTSISAGGVFVLAVTALDQSNDTVPGYSGTVHLTSTDGQAALPSTVTLTNGVGFFAVVLRTAGADTITATDSASSGVTGSATVTVSGLAATHFVVSAPTSGITGTPLNVTVSAQDQFGNIMGNYAGTVHFTSNDASAGLPANTTLSSGKGTFAVTFNTPGNHTVTAADSSITGTSNNIFVLGLVVSSFTPTPSGFVAVFDKPFVPSVINLYDSQGVFGADDVLLTGPNAPQTSYHGSLIIDPTDKTITFVKTSTFTNSINSFDPSTGVLAAGTYTATFRSAQNGFMDSLGSLLDGNASGIPGTNFVTTFVVSSTVTKWVGVPGFARGPDSTHSINLPNNNATAGIPISISDGSGVTSGSFTLQYNSALLTVNAAAVNAALAGASLSLSASSTPGNAVINFTSPTALASGPVRLGGLSAIVPNSAASFYTAKGLLHFSSVQLNGGALTAGGDDTIEVVAYFGDATGDAALSGGDSAAISRVSTAVDDNPANGVISGFAAYQLADPVLIGDLVAGGNVSASSVTLINSYLTGTVRTQIPPIPTGLVITATGPDPSLSLPTNVLALPGATVDVPVNIDTAHPDGSTGMTEAILALRFDPQVFDLSASDVQLGSLPEASIGWQLTAAVNDQTGEIGIDLYSETAIQTTAGGSLVTIALHVRDGAPPGATALSLVPLVNPSGKEVFQTTVSDAKGALVLHTAETSLGTMPGTPGTVTVDSGTQAIEPAAAPIQTGDNAFAAGQLITRNPMDDSALFAISQPIDSTSLAVGQFIARTDKADPFFSSPDQAALGDRVLNQVFANMGEMFGQDNAAGKLALAISAPWTSSVAGWIDDLSGLSPSAPGIPPGWTLDDYLPKLSWDSN